MRPPSAPDESVPFENRYDLRRDAVTIGRDPIGVRAPQPVVRIGRVDVDRGAPAMHAGLTRVGDRPALVGPTQWIKIFLVGRGQCVELQRDLVQLPIYTVDRRDADGVSPGLR